MKTQIPYQYTVLKYIHDSFTGEFLNVGLAFYSQDPTWFHVHLLEKYTRITKTFPTADGENYHKYITNLQLKFDILTSQINQKQSQLWASPQTIESLLAQVLPIDDSALQFGKIYGGLADDIEETFTEMYHRLVETYLPIEQNESRTETEVWQVYSRPLRAHNVIQHLQNHTIITPSTELEFDHAWKNGHWNAMQPLSFDLSKPASINNKALQYLGRNIIIEETKEFGKLYYLLGKPRRPDNTLINAYNKAKDLLFTHQHAKKIEIIEEDGAEDFARLIGAQIEKDITHEEA